MIDFGAKKKTYSSAQHYSATKTESPAGAASSAPTSTTPTQSTSPSSSSPISNGNKAKGLATKNNASSKSAFDGFDNEEEDDSVEAPAKSAQFSPPEMSPTSTTPEFSRKPVGTSTKPAGKLGAKKVTPASKSFFADFDLESDEEKEEAAPVSKAKFDDATSQFSRLSYNDAPTKKGQSQNNSYSNNSPNMNSPSSSGSRGKPGNAPSRRDDAPEYARQKFSNAKSISSDQYFGRDKEETNSYEKETRMARFSGAQSISSADYFERDESVTIADMSASDVARRIAYNAKSDMNDFSSVVVQGGKKLSAMANSMLNELQERYS